MQITIQSSSKQIYSTNKADYIQLPGIDGYIGILPGHEPLITTLDIGEVIVRENGTEKSIAINGGFAQITGKNVYILADEAHLASNKVDEEIEEAIKRAEEKLKGDLEPSELIQLEKQIKYNKLRKKLNSSM